MAINTSSAAMAGLTEDTDIRSILKAIELINHLALELDVDSAMDSVRNVVLELLECDRVTLFLILEHRQELRGRTGEQSDTPIIVKYGEGVAGSVAVTGELVNIPDAYECPLFNSEVDRRTGYHTKSILCCAISDMSGKCKAVLQALNKRGGAPFTNRDEHVLKLFSMHLGNTLAKARLHEEAKREKQRLATLSNCFKRMNKVTSLMGALDTMVEAVQELVRAESIVVFLKDQARGELWTNVGDPNAVNLGQGHVIRTKQGCGVIGRCAQKGQQQSMLFMSGEEVTDEVLLELQQYLPDEHKLRDLLLQPVMDPSNDTCLAVLIAVNKSTGTAHNDIWFEDTFTASDCNALSVFSMEVADILGQRSLEVSFASALSVVGANGAHTTNAHSSSNVALGNLLRAQLMEYSHSNPGVDAFASCAGNLSPKATSFSSRCTSGSLSLSRELGSGDVRELEAQQLRSQSASLAPSRGASVRLRDHSNAGLSSPQQSMPRMLPARSNVAAFISSRVTSHGGDFASSLSSQFDPVSARETLLSWAFDCAEACSNELVKWAFEMFMLNGAIETLEINERTVACFLSAVASHYRSDVPYHNFSHAVMVLHTVWMMLESTAARDVLTATEQLVLLVAALCHDLDHDGHTNSFHINAGTELAQRFNDRSVLENHHCALTFAILRKRGANIFEDFAPEEWRAVRKLLIDAILNTDMGQHFSLTNQLTSHALSFDGGEEDRTLLVKLLLHAADISNPVRPFRSAALMAERVQSEFAAQVSEERLLGLPVAPHMDVADAFTRSKMEMHFIDYIVGPLWERLAQVYPTLQPCITQMKQNRQRFAIMACSTPQLPMPDGPLSPVTEAADANDTGASAAPQPMAADISQAIAAKQLQSPPVVKDEGAEGTGNIKAWHEDEAAPNGVQSA